MIKYVNSLNRLIFINNRDLLDLLDPKVLLVVLVLL